MSYMGKGGFDLSNFQVDVYLQHILTATAINLVRVFNWLENVPLAKTRTSPFSRFVYSDFPK